MPPMTTTGDISQRTAGFIAKELLERAQPLLIVSQFGQPKPLPLHSTRTMKFRGYEHLPNQPKPLTEGVTPQASRPTFRDVEVTIGQYGDWIELTDVLHDTHEDPLIPEFSDILGEQAAIMMERVVIGGLMAGTNVHFSGSAGGVMATSRSGVNEPISLALQRRIIRGMKRQLAQPITSLISASPNFATQPIPPSYVAVCHTDCEADIREMPGFVPVEKYGQQSPLRGEIGSVEGVRYCATTVLEPFTGAEGGAAPNAATPVESSDGGCADVYPIFYFGKNAFGVIPFARGSKRNDSPIMPCVLNPNTQRGGDPLGQRGSIGWKSWSASVILYDFFMARAEVAVRKL